MISKKIFSWIMVLFPFIVGIIYSIVETEREKRLGIKPKKLTKEDYLEFSVTAFVIIFLFVESCRMGVL